MKLSRLVLLTLVACLPLVALAQDGSTERNAAATGRPVAESAAGYDLGAVLAKRSGAGLTVMAVTPGGGAERMKLRAGDRILSINGMSLETPTPTSTMQQALAAGGSAVRLEVARGARSFAADDRADAGDPAAARDRPTGCGYVTDQGPTPTLSENIFPVVITKVAGASTPLYPVNRHRLDAGRQVLVVAEGIPATRFSSVQLIQRQRMRRQLDARAYKALIVDVEPGMRYHVGAQLLPDRMDRRSMLDNEYWKPVMWKEVAEPCR